MKDRRLLSPAMKVLQKIIDNPNSTTAERVAAIKGFTELVTMADKKAISEARIKAAELKLRADAAKGDFGV